MNFNEIAVNRQSCRSFDPNRNVEQHKLDAILNSAILSPSACNGQPYYISVCRNRSAKSIAEAAMHMGRNPFVADAPVMIVISEKPYVKTAAVGSKIMGIDYRSIDIGILSAYITAEAAAQGLGSCMIGWFNEKKIRQVCSVDGKIQLVIALGYAKAEDKLRDKKRKPFADLIGYVD